MHWYNFNISFLFSFNNNFQTISTAIVTCRTFFFYFLHRPKFWIIACTGSNLLILMPLTIWILADNVHIFVGISYVCQIGTAWAFELFIAITTVGWLHISKKLVLAAVFALKRALAHLCIALENLILLYL